ncbi:hypothetical protein HYALB_00008540 [Hymenoscyphus albidus]|uniref:NAD(P)-binding protein n=1 Tax=Hymenoscyphus albidus TaxID=595503 RepID=A0A9N9LJ56_9HELO|nr:hypothetical protein HYALB_00008540 [Hymenoscyphus albidus]
MLYGLLSRPAVHFDTEKDLPDLSGKVIAITGGNAGLGLETILRLAPHSPSHIYILARNASSTSSSISHVQSLVSNCCPLTHIPCDLSDLSSVSSCAETFLKSTSRLDILFLNAGVMMVPPGLTKQGYEIQFGTNHLGHFLLSELLVGIMEKTAKEGGDVRVVVVSSIGMQFSPKSGIPYASLQSTGSAFIFSSLWRYGTSKLANALFAREFHARYHGQGITCVSVHPGVIATGLWSSFFQFAENWVAVVGQGTWNSCDMGKARELWEWSEKAVEGYLK